MSTHQCCLLPALLLAASTLAAQSIGGVGSVEGTVTDPSGSLVPGAAVVLSNKVTGFKQAVSTRDNGTFHFPRVPANAYHLEIRATGFADFDRDIQVRGAVPVAVQASLQLAGGGVSVTVEATGSDVLENVPYAHNDISEQIYSKLPTSSPGSGLSDAITLGTPGVVADSNGFFHPLGDHGQTTFSIDGQTISDQQSKQFSTQVPLNAIDTMELITGGPSAEFGDKTSLVVNAVTKSGIGHKPYGSFMPQYGSFGTVGEEGTLGFGNSKVGNFLSANVLRTGRFLDTPEFVPIHAIGNSYTIFDHVDYRPSAKDAFHLNLFNARNWFQVPNTYDQLSQDQRQKSLTYNIGLGYQRTFNSSTLLTVSPFLRQDQIGYFPSNDVFADTPISPWQSRRLTNWGTRADISRVKGAHNVKVGTQLMQTRLGERFALGITDPLYNAVCANADGEPQLAPGILDPADCAGAGLAPNEGLQPGLVPYDLTRGGKPFQFAGKANINEYAFFVQDSITWHNWSLTPGLRIDQYDGLTTATGVEPRFGISYHVKKTGTVIRGAYSRTLETPYNENLVLSSSTGAGGLAENVFGAQAATPIQPGRRNQLNGGFQQSIDNLFLIDADYFWKATDNAFDFGTLLNTPITFPISWRESKIDGVALRVSTTNIHGFQAFVTMGHNRARFFGPSNGGLVFNSPLDTGVFRIDHDQAFQQTTHLRYQFPKKGPWLAFTWRYDSGEVAGAVPDLESALQLTAAQQAAIGFYCGGVQATLDNPITSCTSSNWGAVRLRIPATGTENDDHNPPRVTPRHLFNIGVGDDDVLHTEKVKMVARFSVENLTNEVALYNFLSTFSGTHFVGPRTYRAELGVTF